VSVIGQQISHYRILSRIGQGGMGEVFLAEDLSLDRKVALKFLPTTRADDQSARRRLIREAHSAARLDHPFICKIYEVGQSDGQPFIAMEYVEGTTLGRQIAQGPLPLSEAIRIASELADAVELAHRSGIVHRDLKPSNVMLTPDGHVKVMDFGLAQQMTSLGIDSTTIGAMTATGTGAFTGTLAYMSPEQLRSLPVDARSDVFAFGLLLYEMLTGRHPFRRSTAITTTDALLNDVEPPLGQFIADVPPLLEHVIHRSLAKDRDQRYQSLREARIDLGILSGESASASQRVPLRPRRRSRWLFIAAATVAIAGGAAALRFWPALPPSQQALAFRERDSILIADLENLTGDKVFDRSLRAALEVGIAQSRFVNVFPPARLEDARRRMQKTGSDPLDEAAASEVAVREGVKAVFICSIAQVGGVYSLTARLLDPHTRAAVLTESIQATGKDQVLPALDTLSTRVRRNLGESLAGISQNVPLPKATTSSLEALKMYADSLRVREPQQSADDLLRQAVVLDPNFALAHAELGRRYYLKSEPATRIQGEAHFVKALGLLDRLSTRERLWVTALAEDSRGNRQHAVDAYKTYLAQYPDDARGWFRIGWTQMATLGQLQPAVEAFQRVIALNPSDAGAHVNLATCYSAMGSLQKAVEEYQKAFTLQPAFLTGEYVNHEYGFTLVRLGEVDKAAEVFGRARADAEMKARGDRSLALLDMYRGQYAKAAGYLREAIRQNRANGAGVSEFRDHLYLARALEAVGDARGFASEVAAAEDLGVRTSLGPEWLQLLAKIRARTGRVRDARRTLAIMEKAALDITTGSSVARSTSRDRAYLDLVRGEIELAEGRPIEAAVLFESANAAEPKHAQVLESLAAAYVAAGRLQEAVKPYEDLITNGPLGNEGQELWLRAHVRLGELYDRLGRPDEARQTYERLLQLWKDADTNVIALTQVKARLANR
jgi:tetratricopeptide (TPR) repeat protein/predicted Ser/Thr protein kinase